MKIKVILIIFLMLTLSFSSIPVHADKEDIGKEDSKSVSDFHQIWYKDSSFSKADTGDGNLLLATSYTNITSSNLAWRDVDKATLEYNFGDDFYLKLGLEDEIEEIVDAEGNIVYREPSDGYVFLKKEVVDSHLGSRVKSFASKNFNFSTISFQGTQYYRVYIPSFNQEYCWKVFDEPDTDAWYTWGSSSSLNFTKRAMFIKLLNRKYGDSLVFDCHHPVTDAGQGIYFNKSYLNSQGIFNPIFEYGWPRQPLFYVEKTVDGNVFYVVSPPHFSTIEIHEATSGSPTGGVFWGYEDTDDDGWNQQITHGDRSTTPNPPGKLNYISDTWYQSFNTRDYFDVITQFGLCGEWHYDYLSGNVVLRDADGDALPSSVSRDPNGYFHGYANDDDWRWCTMSISSTGSIDHCFVDRNTVYSIRGSNKYDNGRYFGYGLNNSQGYEDGICWNQDDEIQTQDMWFFVRGYNYQFNVTRSSGGGTETNSVDFVSEYSYATTDSVLLMRIPVSDQVQGVLRVYNTTTGENLTDAETYSNISIGQYYYDAEDFFVFIGISNVLPDTHLTYQVNCTFDSSFDVVPPGYLELGHNFACRGLILDAYGDPSEGYMAHTKILGYDYENDSYYIQDEDEDFSSSDDWSLSNTVISDGKIYQEMQTDYTWYNGSYLFSYRKLINITGNLDDYQMELVVGNSSGGDINCSGHVQPDFDDVMFVCANNSSVILPFHKWNYTEDEQATFWINNSGNSSQIWMYYGNEHAINKSNPYDTWILWDDFETDWSEGFNPERYSNDLGYEWDPWGEWFIDDGLLYHGSQNIHLSLFWQDSQDYDIAVQTEGKTSDDDYVGVMARHRNGGNEIALLAAFEPEHDRVTLGYRWDDLESGSNTNIGVNSSVGTLNTDEYHTIELKVEGAYNDLHCEVDLDGNTAIVEDTVEIWENGGYNGIYSGANSPYASFKYLRIRNWTSDEPSWGNISEEETIVHPDAENCTYLYRKPIYITALENTTSFFTEQFTIKYESDMDSSFSDLRFVDIDGRMLDYYIDSYDSEEATVTVKFQGAIEGNNTAGFMYYGDGNTTSLSNRSHIYLLWNDFEDGTVQDFTTSYGAGVTSIGHLNGVYGMRALNPSSTADPYAKAQCPSTYGHDQLKITYWADTENLDSSDEEGRFRIFKDNEYYSYITKETFSDYYDDEWELRSETITHKYLGPNFALGLQFYLNIDGRGYDDVIYFDDIKIRPTLGGVSSSMGLAESQQVSSSGYGQTIYSYYSNVESVNLTVYDNTSDGNITYSVSNDAGDTWHSISNNSEVEFLGDGTTLIFKIYMNTTNTSSTCPYVEGYTLSVEIEPYMTPGHILVESKWNCSHGNYECDMSTTSIDRGEYTWEIEFEDIYSGITFKTSGPLFIDYPISGYDPDDNDNPIYYSAYLYYTFYDIESGLGLDDNYFKMYISSDTEFDAGDRVKGGVKPTSLSAVHYIKATDYFGNKVWPVNESYYVLSPIEEAETYLDLRFDLCQFRVKNMNESYVLFKLIDPDSSQEVTRIIPPYEETEFFLLNGTYDLQVFYYYNNNGTLKGLAETNDYPVNGDTFYWIAGYSVADIVIALWYSNMTIHDQLINLSVYVNNFNSTVFQQEINSNVLLSNIESNITNQFVYTNTQINNTMSDIENQYIGILSWLNNTNSSIENMSVDIDTWFDTINSSIGSMNISMLSYLDIQNNTIDYMNTTFLALFDQQENTIDNLSQDISFWFAQVNNDTNNLSQNVTFYFGQVNNNIDNLSQNVTSFFLQQNENITYMENNIFSWINQQNDNISTMDQNVTYFFTQTNNNISFLSQDIFSWVSQQNENISNLSQDISTLFIQTNDNVTYMKQNISMWFTQQNNNITTLEQTIVQTIGQTNNNISNMSQNVTSFFVQTNDNISYIHQNITQWFSQQNSNISTMESTIVQLLGQTNTDVSNLSQNISTFIIQQNYNITSLRQNLSQWLYQQNINISSVEQTIVQSIIEQNNNISTLDSNVTQIHISLNENISDFRQSITSHILATNINISNLSQDMYSFFASQNINVSTLTQNLTTFFGVLNENITDMNQSIAALFVFQNENISNIYNQGVSILNSVFNNNVSVWNQTYTIMTITIELNSTVHNRTEMIMNLINCTNETIVEKAVEILSGVQANSTWVFNRVGSAIDSIISSEQNLSDQSISQALDIIANVSSSSSQIFNQTLDIIQAISSAHTSIVNQTLYILQNVTYMGINISSILSRLGMIDSTLDDLADLVNNLNLSNLADLEDILNKLNDILDQFELPHEWQIPSVNYSINDTMPPISTIYATNTLGGGINVHYSSADAYGVASVTIYYRLTNTTTWRLWKATELASGDLDFTEETLSNGTTYWFRCLGIDTSGNVENVSTTNTCNLTYVYRSAPSSPGYGSTANMINQATVQNIYFWVVVILFFMLLGVLVWHKRHIRRKILKRETKKRNPVFYEEEI